MSGSERGAYDRRRFLQLVGLAGAGAVLGGCSGSGGGGGGAGSTTTPSGFPIGAAAHAKSKPVKVTFWNSMTNANLTTLQSLAKQFNSSQADVAVDLVFQQSYTDTLTAYTAAAGSHTLPDLVQIENVDLQLMIDSKTIVAAEDAVAADKYDLSGILGASVDYFKVGGTLWGMPFNQSTQVMYFDQTAFEKAGLDPAKPPTTLDEYKAACQAIVSKKVAKYGTSLKITSSNFELWMSQAGQELVNNGNGRTSRATAVDFGNATGQMLFGFYTDMFSSKLAQPTLGVGSGAFDNLLAIAGGEAPMAIETSAALGTVLATLPTLSKTLKLGVGPLPAPPGPGGVPYGGGGLYIVNQSPPERQDGAWQFVKFLLEASSMATWSVGSGYIPIVEAAVNEAGLQSAWAKIPQYKVAYDTVLATKPSPATDGAVLGSLAQVETYVQNAIQAISTGTAASRALSQAVSQSNAEIASYDSRV
jgi:sn-glycerol 3-phosphate transport system substrate-binding protein